MTSLNDIANSVYLLKMRLNRVKGAEDELLARGTQHKQTRTGGTGNVSGKMSLNTGSADRDKLQRDTSIFPKPHNRKMDRAGKRTGDKIPMTGTAGVGGEKQTFNPAGSKTDRHRTAQGEISSSGVLGSGKERKTKPTSSSPGYYMDKRPGKTRTISAGKKPKGYTPPDYKPTPGSDVKERLSYPVHSEEEREELHTTPGKDFDKKVAEQKEQRRIASQRKQRKREMREKYPEHNKPKQHDNRLKPGESFTPKKREGKDVPESSKLRTDRGRRAAERGAARSQLSHGGSKQHGEKGSEHGKEREIRHGKLTRQNEGNKRVSGRETKDTKYFDYQGTEVGTGSKGKRGKDAEPPTNETIAERFPKSTKEGERIARKREQQKESNKSFDDLQRDARLALMRLERLEKKSPGNFRDAHIDEEIAQTDLAPVGQDIPFSRVAPKNRKAGLKRNLYPKENPKMSDKEQYGYPGMTISRDTARKLKSKDLNN